MKKTPTKSKTKAAAKLLPFDPARYLVTDTAVVEYMNAVVELNDPALRCLARRDIARARRLAR